ncbi:hypothetical protein SDC9_129847 [bioreactor metagenome]|uniref:Uncharacterized protein n=1 Tax=bioreactor metagenome TaxID=1076179 RepID=A0A645D0Z0_9ZZZZ
MATAVSDRVNWTGTDNIFIFIGSIELRHADSDFLPPAVLPAYLIGDEKRLVGLFVLGHDIILHVVSQLQQKRFIGISIGCRFASGSQAGTSIGSGIVVFALHPDNGGTMYT